MAAHRQPMPSVLDGDPYDDLLSRTRELRAEQRILRDQWFQGLPLESKEELLFELEVLLKAAACFGNPRNHPGRPRRAPIVAQDFREATVCFRDGLQRAIALTRQLLGPKDKALVFHRYLETVLPGDVERTRLVRQGTSQSAPEESLVSLRHGLTSSVEVFEGALRAPRIPFRLFYALVSTVQREISRNTFFNPLQALEFRPEFDRIHSTQVLELIRHVPGDEAHRLVALTFLSLFRMVRYLRLISRILVESAGKRRRAGGRIYLVLSVLRSDARALSDYLRQNAGQLLGTSFERDVFAISATDIAARADGLRAAAHRLIGIRSALEGISANLRLEMRRAFMHDLPTIDAGHADAEFRAAMQAVVGNLRPALRNTILFLGKALGASIEEGVFDDQAARRESSERLRRDVWMFGQIVRAFATKAQHSPSADGWAAVNDFQYVKEFLTYFRAMGYPLLRAADYPRFEAFMSAIDGLQDTDLVDPARLATAIEECLAFHAFLQRLFEEISKRDVLEGVPFQRRDAAAALKLYLGERGARD